MAELGLHHEGRQDQGGGVDEERDAQAEAGQHPADDRPAHIADEEGEA